MCEISPSRSRPNDDGFQVRREWEVRTSGPLPGSSYWGHVGGVRPAGRQNAASWVRDGVWAARRRAGALVGSIGAGGVGRGRGRGPCRRLTAAPAAGSGATVLIPAAGLRTSRSTMASLGRGSWEPRPVNAFAQGTGPERLRILWVQGRAIEVLSASLGSRYTPGLSTRACFGGGVMPVCAAAVFLAPRVCGVLAPFSAGSAGHWGSSVATEAI